jgi:outer membrane lipase/esterase
MNTPAFSHSYQRTGSLVWRLFLLCFLSLCLAASSFALTHFSKVVVFGDSLSDTGRLYQLTDHAFPLKGAYWQGRMSNGPVWVEQLAHAFRLDGRLHNYAVTGALTGPTAFEPTGNVWSDTFTGLEGTSLVGQFSSYLARTGGQVDPDALYVVEGGANDLITPLFLLLMSNPTPEAFNLAVYEMTVPIVQNTATIVGTLRQLGARYIAVVNIADFGLTPRILAYGPQASFIVSSVVAAVNGAVDAQIGGIEAASAFPIARVSAYAVIRSVVTDPAGFGFSEVGANYMSLDPSSWSVSFATEHKKDAMSWFFWDDLHPTTAGHAVFAEAAELAIEAAYPGVPHSKK